MLVHPSPRFNPHPISRPGATLEVQRDNFLGLTVSILTRSHDRVQHWWREPVPFNETAFQSSPDLTTGCNLIELANLITYALVSILTRSHDRVQR